MKSEEWYEKLTPEARYTFDMIDKYHNYFSNQDKKYKVIVRTLKILILLLAMLSTIICGINDVINSTFHKILGITATSAITFFTAISAYFNFEEYWVRNITIHIELNILRDNFVFDAISNKMDSANLNVYKNKLDNLQQKNIKYWQKAIKHI
ncbi:MAG: SLATT domain-containing protein [Clostridia bacterium]|nr:SLATT domain-containing protein [Clostridia bacterium]